MTMTDVATTGVVASARSASIYSGGNGSGLPVFTDTPTTALKNRTFDRTARTSKAVITQDTQPVSGEQLWSHPPV